MIQSIKANSIRTLLLLLSFALLSLITACGGSTDDPNEVKGYSISMPKPDVEGDWSNYILTATVTNNFGEPAIGKAVTFAVTTNNSGATITPLNGGKTDANGQAFAIFTPGTNNPTEVVEDTIQASMKGAATSVLLFQRGEIITPVTYSIELASQGGESLEAGRISLITAKVTSSDDDATLSGITVNFSLLSNVSNATITPVNNGLTDASGKATAIYKAGCTAGCECPQPQTTPCSTCNVCSAGGCVPAQDIIQASIAEGAVGVIIIEVTGEAIGTSTP